MILLHAFFNSIWPNVDAEYDNEHWGQSFQNFMQGHIFYHLYYLNAVNAMEDMVRIPLEQNTGTPISLVWASQYSELILNFYFFPFDAPDLRRYADQLFARGDIDNILRGDIADHFVGGKANPGSIPGQGAKGTIKDFRVALLVASQKIRDLATIDCPYGGYCGEP